MFSREQWVLLICPCYFFQMESGHVSSSHGTWSRHEAHTKSSSKSSLNMSKSQDPWMLRHSSLKERSAFIVSMSKNPYFVFALSSSGAVYFGQWCLLTQRGHVLQGAICVLLQIHVFSLILITLDRQDEFPFTF